MIRSSSTIIALAAAAALASSSLFAAAQTAPASGPRKVTIYLTAKGEQLSSSEGADHRAEITMRDSVGGMMREFYPSGKLQRIIPFAHVQRGIKHGVEMTFADNGSVQTRQEFVAGLAEGALVQYYPAGSVKSRTNFLHDKLTGKECFTLAGASRNCPPDDTAPAYPGGEPALIGYFMQKVKAPTGVLQTTIEGKVHTLHLAVVRLKFAIDSLGAVTNTTVLYSPTPSWSAAVLKAVPKLQHFVPAQHDGRMVADAVEVALSFSLDEQRYQAGSSVQPSYQTNLGEARGTREVNFRPQYQDRVIIKR